MKAGYDSAAYPPFAVTADLVVVTVRPPSLRVLLIERAEAPFDGYLALPGGFVGEHEDLAATARRVLAAKTGIDVSEVHLEQLGTYGAPGRDPRMRVVSVAYLAFLADPPAAVAGTDSRRAEWMSIDSFVDWRLAFDHGEILGDGIERARAKLEYTTLATEFCRPEFTLGELRGVYEAAWGRAIDPANFQRKVLGTEGFVEPTGRTAPQKKGRPARTYRAGLAVELVPPLRRAES